MLMAYLILLITNVTRKRSKVQRICFNYVKLTLHCNINNSLQTHASQPKVHAAYSGFGTSENNK